MMLLNDLRTAFRTLRKRRTYAVLNVLGLAAGLGVALLVFTFVRDELRYDRFHDDADRIYRLTMRMENSPTPHWPSTFLPLGAAAAERLPEVAAATRVQTVSERLFTRGDARFREANAFYVEPSFFDVFSFTLVQGDPAALGRPHTLALTPEAARRYFGDEDPVGGTITIDGEQDYEVVGLVAPPPSTSHLQFEVLVSMASDEPPPDRAWSRLVHTYLRLRSDADAAALAAKLPAFTEAVMPERQRTGTTLVLQPLTDIHLYGRFERDIQPQGDIRYVWLFGALGLVVLLIAVVNYMNLATARAAERAKEVGVRKTLGAGRGQLARQFLIESVLLTAVAAVLGVALAQVVLPAFADLMQRDLRLPFTPAGLVVLVVGVVLVGLIAGSYPAFVLSRFRPAGAFRGQLPSHGLPLLRKGLVVFQFAAGVALLACTAIVFQQLQFVQTTRLGFEKEHVLVIEAHDALTENRQAFKAALLAHPAVEHAALTYALPSRPFALGFLPYKGVEGAVQPGEETHAVFDLSWGDADFDDVLGLELVAGRFFDPRRPGDVGSAVVNEAMVRQLGLAEPVGTRVTPPRGAPYEIVGVVRDFHTGSMHEAVGPTMLQYNPDAARRALVRLRPGTDLPELLHDLEATWAQFAPQLPFEYTFLDDDFAAMYRAERRLGRFFFACAGLAIFVACLGLFGLAAFTAEQRTKEIGIRKVLGASVAGLVALLARGFAGLVVFAFALAVPLAYVASSRWLEAFAYRIDVGPGPFFAAGLTALALALATVGVHALRAARRNPADTLRYE